MSWNIRLFLNFCLSQKTLCCRKLIVFSCLQFADCYIWSRIFVMWCDFRVLITITESFSLKSFLCNDITMISFKCLGSKSWCYRKHVFVFEIVSLKGLNKFDQIIFFPVTFFWVKGFICHYGKSVKTFPFWALTFFCFLES